jgi:alanyl-tRNA synthetase
VFNKPGEKKFWSDECVEFNYNWLTQGLGIDAAEITFIEDVWAGGGNLGPSIEYFVGGMELGNMVFMQFKTNGDGSRVPLDVQVIDVGIGLERVPWLVNGGATSYMDVFPSALEYTLGKLEMVGSAPKRAHCNGVILRLLLGAQEHVSRLTNFLSGPRATHSRLFYSRLRAVFGTNSALCRAC